MTFLIKFRTLLVAVLVWAIGVVLFTRVALTVSHDWTPALAAGALFYGWQIDVITMTLIRLFEPVRGWLSPAPVTAYPCYDVAPNEDDEDEDDRDRWDE